MHAKLSTLSEGLYLYLILVAWGIGVVEAQTPAFDRSASVQTSSNPSMRPIAATEEAHWKPNYFQPAPMDTSASGYTTGTIGVRNPTTAQPSSEEAKPWPTAVRRGLGFWHKPATSPLPKSTYSRLQPVWRLGTRGVPEPTSTPTKRLVTRDIDTSTSTPTKRLVTRDIDTSMSMPTKRLATRDIETATPTQTKRLVTRAIPSAIFNSTPRPMFAARGKADDGTPTQAPVLLALSILSEQVPLTPGHRVRDHHRHHEATNPYKSSLPTLSTSIRSNITASSSTAATSTFPTSYAAAKLGHALLLPPAALAAKASDGNAPIAAQIREAWHWLVLPVVVGGFLL